MLEVKKIKIIGVPPGQAPEWVRRAWIGIEMPLSLVQPDSDDIIVGVLDKKPNDENSGGYAIDGSVAIELLERKNIEAAQWWRNNAPRVLSAGYCLVFDKKVCQLC